MGTSLDRAPHRLEELDSLRGGAAMVVVAYHATTFWNAPYPAWWRGVLRSPFSIFFDGPDAVLLFFVLSGFVLYLPYLTAHSRTGYPRFLIKRICRIYLPYLAALVLSATENEWLHRTQPFPTQAIVPHLLFIGPGPLFVFNPVFWTLVHEMRISIAFPLVAFFAGRMPLIAGVLAGLGLCCAGLTLEGTSHGEWITVGYAGLFLLGACVARHLDQVRALAAAIGPYGRAVTFVLAIELLKTTRWIPMRLQVLSVETTVRSTGVTLILILAMTTVYFKRLLHSRSLRWLGKVSYSLYLVHMTVFYCVTSLLWARIEHHKSLMVAAVAVALVTADLFHRWVEMPSMRLGQRLGRRPRPAVDPIPDGRLVQELP